MKKPVMTPAQIDTIKAILICTERTDTWFDAMDVFPRRDAQDNARRRSLALLAKNGVLRRHGNTSRYWIVSREVLNEIAAGNHVDKPAD